MESFPQNTNTKACTLPVYEMNGVFFWRFFYLTNIYLIPTWPDLLGSTKVTKDYYGIYKFYSIFLLNNVWKHLRLFINWESTSLCGLSFDIPFLELRQQSEYCLYTSNLTFITFVIYCTYQFTVSARLCTHWWQKCHFVFIFFLVHNT